MVDLLKLQGIWTQYGLEKLASIMPGEEPLAIAFCAVGDGNGSLPVVEPSQTELLNEVWRGPVNGVTVNPDDPTDVLVDAVIPNNVGGFFIREWGIFDADNKLIAVGPHDEMHKPLLTDGQAAEFLERFHLPVSNTGTIKLSIASQSLATQAQVKGYVDANARVALWNAGFCYAPATSAPPDKSSLSLCFGSDGALYLATAISGPGTEAGPKDPVTTTGYWIKLDITVNGIAPDEQRNVQLTYVVTQSEFDALQAAGTLVPGAMYLVGNTTEIGGGWQWLVW